MKREERKDDFLLKNVEEPSDPPDELAQNVYSKRLRVYIQNVPGELGALHLPPSGKIVRNPSRRQKKSKHHFSSRDPQNAVGTCSIDFCCFVGHAIGWQ